MSYHHDQLPPRPGARSYELLGANQRVFFAYLHIAFDPGFRPVIRSLRDMRVGRNAWIFSPESWHQSSHPDPSFGANYELLATAEMVGLFWTICYLYQQFYGDGPQDLDEVGDILIRRMGDPADAARDASYHEGIPFSQWQVGTPTYAAEAKQYGYQTFRDLYLETPQIIVDVLAIQHVNIRQLT